MYGIVNITYVGETSHHRGLKLCTLSKEFKIYFESDFEKNLLRNYNYYMGYILHINSYNLVLYNVDEIIRDSIVTFTYHLDNVKTEDYSSNKIGIWLEKNDKIPIKELYNSLFKSLLTQTQGGYAINIEQKKGDILTNVGLCVIGGYCEKKSIKPQYSSEIVIDNLNLFYINGGINIFAPNDFLLNFFVIIVYYRQNKLYIDKTNIIRPPTLIKIDTCEEYKISFSLEKTILPMDVVKFSQTSKDMSQKTDFLTCFPQNKTCNLTDDLGFIFDPGYLNFSVKHLEYNKFYFEVTIMQNWLRKNDAYKIEYFTFDMENGECDNINYFNAPEIFIEDEPEDKNKTDSTTKKGEEKTEDNDTLGGASDIPHVLIEPESITSDSDLSTQTPKKKADLKTDMIVAIALGSVIGACLIVYAIYTIINRSRSKQAQPKFL